MAYRKFYKKPAEIENKAPASRKSIPWSDQQLTVFNACLNEKAVAVSACAGSGKTTTLVEAVWRILDKSPKAKILLLAFNNKIKAELQDRLFGLPVSVHTVHSHGYAALREYWSHKAAKRNGKVSWNIEGGAGPSQLKMAEAYVGYEPEKANDRQELCRLVSLCKAWMIFSQVKVKEIADKYQIIPQNVSEESFLNGAWEMLKLNHAAPAAGNTITFDDMVWIPASHDDCLVEKYDYVMVDEAQDLSLDRHSLVKKSLKQNGTIIIVGDVFQCVSINSIIETNNGSKLAKDIIAGDKIKSYKNGKISFSEVLSINNSSEKKGFKVTLEDGKNLTMTGSHKVWASLMTLKKDQLIVYLMYQRKRGFRVGITNKVNAKIGNFGQRTYSEQADKLWIINVCDSREFALFCEQFISLKYQIPTSVFSAEARNINQDRVDKIFSVFGQNGFKLLEDVGMSFDLPHWSAKGSFNNRFTVNINSQTTKGTNISIEWNEVDTVKTGIFPEAKKYKKSTMRIRKYFNNYDDAVNLATQWASKIKGSVIRDCLYIKNAFTPPRLINVASLYVGMSLPIEENGNIVMKTISNIEIVDDEFVDINVNKTQNFIANGILTHNCIYGFSGADSDSLPNMIADYSASVYPLTVTRRCGKNIVERAQQFNSEIEAANDAHDGEISSIDISKLAETVSAGEAIVSRTNAPLLKLYFQLAKMRKQVCFIGRDFGGMMKGYLYGFKKGSGKKYFTALDAIETLENWFGAKEQAASLKNKEVSQFYVDLYETLKVVLDDLDNPIDSTDSFEEALSRCDNFVDTPNDKSIVLSSTHRAKGLEWGTVYMLTSTYKSENQEELNLNYVAVTRAKNRLVLVEGKLK